MSSEAGKGGANKIVSGYPLFRTEKRTRGQFRKDALKDKGADSFLDLLSSGMCPQWIWFLLCLIIYDVTKKPAWQSGPRMYPGVLCMLGKCSASELHPQIIRFRYCINLYELLRCSGCLFQLHSSCFMNPISRPL